MILKSLPKLWWWVGCNYFSVIPSLIGDLLDCWNLLGLALDRIDGGKAIGYPDAARLVAEAADKMNITNKTVLVIGTEVPWMETILLQRKPRSRE